MNIWELCKCTPGYICPFCKLLTAVAISVLFGLACYLIGRRTAAGKK